MDNNSTVLSVIAIVISCVSLGWSIAWSVFQYWQARSRVKAQIAYSPGEGGIKVKVWNDGKSPVYVSSVALHYSLKDQELEQPFSSAEYINEDSLLPVGGRSVDFLGLRESHTRTGVLLAFQASPQKVYVTIRSVTGELCRLKSGVVTPALRQFFSIQESGGGS